MSTPPVSDREMKATISAVNKHGSVARAAKVLGLAESTVRTRLRNARQGPRGKASAEPPPKASVGRSPEEFLTTYDRSTFVPDRIRDGLKRLGSNWAYESEFARICQVSLTDLGDYRDQFKDHIVLVERSRRAWCGSKAQAEKFRSKVS